MPLHKCWLVLLHPPPSSSCTTLSFFGRRLRTQLTLCRCEEFSFWSLSSGLDLPMPPCQCRLPNFQTAPFKLCPRRFFFASQLPRPCPLPTSVILRFLIPWVETRSEPCLCSPQRLPSGKAISPIGCSKPGAYSQHCLILFFVC